MYQYLANLTSHKSDFFLKASLKERWKEIQGTEKFLIFSRHILNPFTKSNNCGSWDLTSNKLQLLPLSLSKGSKNSFVPDLIYLHFISESKLADSKTWLLKRYSPTPFSTGLATNLQNAVSIWHGWALGAVIAIVFKGLLGVSLWKAGLALSSISFRSSGDTYF